VCLIDKAKLYCKKYITIRWRKIILG